MTDTQTAAQHSPSSEHTVTTSKMIALALVLACVLAYSRAFATSFSGFTQSMQNGSFGTISFVCSLTRFLALTLITILGAFGHRFTTSRLLNVCGLLMAVAVLIIFAGIRDDLTLVFAGISGAASGFAMFTIMLYLADQPVRQVVRISLLGLIFGGVLIGLTVGLPVIPATVLLILSGAIWAPCLLKVDNSLAPCNPDGGMSREQARRFPWFAAIMFCICGILCSMLYGFSTQLSWASGQPTNVAVLGIAVIAALIPTTLLVLRGDKHMHFVWIPLFVLLLASALLSCFDVPYANALAVSLLMASVFCYHFLRWMVFPSLVGQADVPHVLTCGLLLVLTNGFLNVNTGQALASVLPDTMRARGGVVSVVLLLLVCCLAVAWILDRMPAMKNSADAQAVSANADSEDADFVDASLKDNDHSDTDRSDKDHPSTIDSDRASSNLERRCAELSYKADLTPREREIFTLTARGYSSPFIAEKLVISDSTVRFHQRNIYTKLGVNSKQELIALVNQEAE